MEPSEEKGSGRILLDSKKTRTNLNQIYSFNSTFELNSVTGIKERYVIYLLTKFIGEYNFLSE